MRLLSARLSAKRRSPFAGLVVLLIGPADDRRRRTPLLSPASAETIAADQSTVDQGRALFLVGCASCHGKNGEGIVTKRGTQYGPPLAGVGAAAVDFQVGTGRMPMARPGVQAHRKKVVYTPEEISALAAYVASLGPGPAIPAEVGVRHQGRRQRGDRPRRPVLRAPTAPPATTSRPSGGALPGGKFAPSLKGVSEKHIYEAMLTGPQQMPVFSDGVLKPEEKRDIIAYVKSIQDDPELRRHRAGLPRPGQRGPGRPGSSASAPSSASPSGSPRTRFAPRRESRRDRRPHALPAHVDVRARLRGRDERARRPDRRPGPAAALAASHRRRREAPRSARSARSRRCSGCPALFACSSCVSYFVFKVGDDPTIIAGYGASNVALGVTLGIALLLIGIAAIQWARKLMSDVEIVEMRHPAALERRGPRGGGRRASRPASTTPASAAAR